MGGFKNETINIVFDSGIIYIIIDHLTKCSKQMKTDCLSNNNPLKKHEDKITNRLVARYLNVGDNIFRYESQSPENYDDATDQYVGRIDIKVIPRNPLCEFQEYFIIECKRIDGTKPYNQKYITDGVARFVSHPLKYSSYCNKNIMFGYVIKTIDVPDNTGKIDSLQDSLLKGVASTKFALLQKDDSQYYVYICKYSSPHIGQIELWHLFYDFSDVIL